MRERKRRKRRESGLPKTNLNLPMPIGVMPPRGHTMKKKAFTKVERLEEWPDPPDEYKTQEAKDEMAKVGTMISNEHTMVDMLGGIVALLDTILYELRQPPHSQEEDNGE